MTEDKGPGDRPGSQPDPAEENKKPRKYTDGINDIMLYIMHSENI
jgi:hypothetical protein